jgi:hypothetical protein
MSIYRYPDMQGICVLPLKCDYGGGVNEKTNAISVFESYFNDNTVKEIMKGEGMLVHPLRFGSSDIFG